MDKLTLKTEKRGVFGKSLGEARKKGKLPCVLYGAKQESTPLFVDLGEFKKVWKKAGESAVIKLSLSTSSIDSLIYDVQTDPVSKEPVHADFYVVDMTKKTTAVVPLEFVGEAQAIKLGGTLVKVIHEVEVEALPLDLPHSLEADVSVLKTVSDKILIKDIKAPAGVEFLAEPEEMVAFVEEVKEEAVPEEERTIEDIEAVSEKGVKEEEEEEGGELT